MLRTIALTLAVAIPLSAQPASQPRLRPANPAATQAAEEFRRVVAELREQIASLKSQNALLVKENADLRGRLAQAEAAAPQKEKPGERPKEIQDAIGKQIVVGMTREEANLTAEARNMVYDKSTTERLSRGKRVVEEKWEFRQWLPGFAQNVWFEDGTVTRVEK